MGQHAPELYRLKYSKELSTAIEDEARRCAIDASKKSAAAQNADYPTFAALVSLSVSTSTYVQTLIFLFLSLTCASSFVSFSCKGNGK
eukprot:c18449_g1_i1 orf=308-571(+)